MSFEITGISLRTDERKPYGQALIVSVTLPDGREIDVLKEWGALPDVVISHHVTETGLRDKAEKT